MTADIEQIYERLYSYCESRDFAGYDPFDGLNSRLFQWSPLKYSRAGRLGFLQLIKRSRLDLRALFLVEEGANPKGLALFALGELARFRATGSDVHAVNAKRLIDRLLPAAIKGKTAEGRETTAFGYNFDWQSRVFFAPRGTPAIVPTAFVFRAIMDAYGIFADPKYLETAKEICRFIVSDLNRSVDTEDEICFSYTPIDRTEIYNASLLAAECLSRIGRMAKSNQYLETAAKAARFVIRRQRGDGAWAYGEENKQAWADNFHTAFILTSLRRISGDVEEIRDEAAGAMHIGIAYWLDNFFLADGMPKYYDNEVYPVDIHSAAAAIASLAELGDLDDRMLPLADKVAEWTCANMLDSDGYFYYQKRKTGIVKTPFMRWGQAWMVYALATLIEARG